MSTPPSNGGYQPDPYQQQYDAYTAPHQPQPGAGGWPPQQPAQPQYGAGPGWPPQQPGHPQYAAGPQPPGWGNQPPKSNNKLPVIVGAALLLIGAIVATVIIVTKKSDSSGTAASGTTTEQASASDQSDGSEPTDTGSDATDTGADASSDSGNGTLPADFPVPSSVQVDDGGTYCSGNTCFGSFKADDPAAAYDDWIAELEDAGYTISSKNIVGKGKDTIWTIEAEGPLSIAIYYASEGAFTSS